MGKTSKRSRKAPPKTKVSKIGWVIMPAETFAKASQGRSVCPVCSEIPKPLPSNGKDAWICQRCKHSFVARLPTDEDLAKLYEAYGYDDAAGRYSPPFLDAIIGDLVDSFEAHRKTLKLLDVGFGSGGLLRIAKTRGWDPHGVELSSAAVAYGREQELGTLYEGDFLTLPIEKAAFDVIVMSELVEHLVDPVPFLRRARELLRVGGLLYMTTPHGRGVSGLALGGEWSVLRPPEHLQLFSIASMRRSLEDVGFSKTEIYTQGLLPHELLQKVRAQFRSSRGAGKATKTDPETSAFRERAGKSVGLNESLSGRRTGRMLKSAANVILRLTSLGDSLRVRAVR
jgi:SAM-dependent methyltransferase